MAELIFNLLFVIFAPIMIISYMIWPKAGDFISLYFTYIVDNKQFVENIEEMNHSMLNYHYSFSRELSNLIIIGKFFHNYRDIFFNKLYRKR